MYRGTTLAELRSNMRAGRTYRPARTVAALAATGATVAGCSFVRQEQQVQACALSRALSSNLDDGSKALEQHGLALLARRSTRHTRNDAERVSMAQAHGAWTRRIAREGNGLGLQGGLAN